LQHGAVIVLFPGEIRTPGVPEQHLHPTLPAAPQQDAGTGAAGLVDLRLPDPRPPVRRTRTRAQAFALARPRGRSCPPSAPGRAPSGSPNEDARSGLRSSLDDRPDREQSDDGDDLSPEDDLVEIDGRPPHTPLAP